MVIFFDIDICKGLIIKFSSFLENVSLELILKKRQKWNEMDLLNT